MPEVIQIGPLVTKEHEAMLESPNTVEQVKRALFSIPGTKSPGPHGFGTFF